MQNVELNYSQHSNESLARNALFDFVRVTLEGIKVMVSWQPTNAFKHILEYSTVNY